MFGNKKKVSTQPLEEKNPSSPSIQITEESEDSTVEVVEICGLEYELLETIEYKDEKYVLLTPYYETEEEYGNEPAEVFIMKEVFSEVLNQPVFEDVSEELAQTIYDIYKYLHPEEFE